ncbi:MAG: CocE/NonD family hydrolase, partial [Planctomycetes bacterium]|nr:CocE/NonD family hydrolase [Planctomycetota bacterium]
RQVRRRRSLAGQCPTPQDWFPRMCAHPERDDYWKTYEFREIVRNCDIPTYYRAVLYDHFIRATCESYQLHRGPKRLVITPGQQGVHGLHADLDLCRERLRWFDYYLKGIQNGVPDDPPVEVFVMGEEKWHAFADWPPSVRERRLALSAGAALVEPRKARPFQDIFTHDPADPIPSADDVQDIRAYAERALVYTSEPLESDITVVGSPAVKLHIRSSAPDAYVIVKLADVFPDGRIRQVTSGRLRAAHRAGHEKAVPLSAGETAQLSITLWPTANTFRAGHRVGLVVADSDAPYCDIYGEVSENSLVGTAANASVLVLPELAG